jgi:hypothetical protein
LGDEPELGGCVIISLMYSCAESDVPNENEKNEIKKRSLL